MGASSIRGISLKVLLPFLLVASSLLLLPAQDTIGEDDPPRGGTVAAPTRMIAYSKSSGTQADIWTMTIDGSNLTQLTTSAAWDEHPSWSPDGTRIVYHSGYMDPKTYALYIMNANGSNKERLTQSDMGCLWPSWSPDAAQIAFSGISARVADHFHVYLRNLNSGSTVALTDQATDDLFPAWAPDGRILFLRKPYGLDGMAGDVFAINPDGSGLTQLTSLGTVNGFSLSPDGTALVIYDRKERAISLLLAHASGSLVQLATPTPYWPFVAIAWSPDGKRIVYACSDLCVDWGSDIFLMNGDGSGRTTVPNAGSAFDPAWRGQ